MLSQANKDTLNKHRPAWMKPTPITGLGDVVAKALKLPVIAGAVKALTGIDPHKPCGGCRKRQEWLNEKVPLGKKE